jgi:hypothetical protein
MFVSYVMNTLFITIKLLLIEIRENTHAAIHLKMINQFLKLVYLRK